MKKLDWYIIRNFLTTLFFILVLFSIVAIVFDISEKIDDFIGKDIPFEEILYYYFSFVPWLINLVSPLIIFITVIYFTSRLAAKSEILAILAGGISFYRLLKPYLIVAALLAVASYYMKGWLIPQSNKRMVEFEATYVRHTYVNTTVHIHRQIEPGVFIYMETYYNIDSVGYKFAMEEFDDKDLQKKLRSRMIRWNGVRGKWIVQDYSIRYIDGLHERIVTGDTLVLDLPLHPEDFGRKDETIAVMTTPQLKKFIDLERLRGEEQVGFYEVELYRRVSMPFAIIILVVLAVAVSSRKIRGGTGLHLGIGIALAFSYLMFLQVSSTFAINANLPAQFAVWLPNFLYGILGIYLLIKAPK